MTFVEPMLTRCCLQTTPVRLHVKPGLSRAGLALDAARTTTCLVYPVRRRSLAQVREIDQIRIRHANFTGTAPRASTPEGDQPPDERKLQLGKTIRTLRPLLPTILLTPLPQSFLSPRISLHLFPSTHPHLPTVSGKLAYNAALWTAPVAWGRIPLVGNVRLQILSERMVRYGGTAGRTNNTSHNGSSSDTPEGDEKLVVKWKTIGKPAHRDGTGGIYRGLGLTSKDPVDKIKGFIAGASAGTKDKESVSSPSELEEEFCGLFVFEFDSQGRISRHVIEHMEEGGNAEGFGRVVSVTEWLLGGFRERKGEEAGLAWCADRDGGRRMLR
ncbi:hypothetical protein MBLNU230_g7352t1 [Neophaeotheca triangularis]